MSTIDDPREIFKRLVALRLQDADESDQIIRSARAKADAMDSHRSPSKKMVFWTASAAAVLLIVAGVVVAGIDNSETRVVAGSSPGGSKSTPAAPISAPNKHQSDTSIDLRFRLVQEGGVGEQTGWPGDPGILRVWTAGPPENPNATVAIGESIASEHTAVDSVTIDTPEARNSVDGWRLETGTSTATKAGPTHGDFDVARWTATDGAQVTLLMRGLTSSAINALVDAVAPPSDPSSYIKTLTALGFVPLTGIDPLDVPAYPLLAPIYKRWESDSGDFVTVGINSESAPDPSRVLWWMGAQRADVDGYHVATAPSGLVYSVVDGQGVTGIASKDVPLKTIVGLMARSVNTAPHGSSGGLPTTVARPEGGG